MFAGHVTQGWANDGVPFAGLSAAARSVWAKHDRKTDSWMPLWRHMADSHAVAGKLWEDWVPLSLKALVSEVLPGGEPDAVQLVSFLAGVHDAGKCSVSFACQVPELADRMRDVGLDMPMRKALGPDRRIAPHGLAGQLLLQEWMCERFGFDARTAGQFAVVIGGHHGTPPDTQQIHDLQLRPHLIRPNGPKGELWRQVQFELMDGCAELAGVTERLPTWGSLRLPQPVQVLLTGIVIMADWLASASELFPYAPESWLPLGGDGERRRLRAAWEGLDLPGRWVPEDPGGTPDEAFAARFPKLAGATIRPVQAEAVRMARSMPVPGLLMIEAPMGEGKTEAAFAAAEILAARSGSGGVLVALPTRATADAMFPRLLAWLEQVLEADDGSRSLVLAHAKAALNEIWAGFLARGNRVLAAVDAEADHCLEVIPTRGSSQLTRERPAELHAHQWLRGRKKQLLASFAVGTIDQALFAGLKTKHLAMRHLAVAGKVVVIDEAHAYDAYMSRYLDRVLEWLAAYRVPVVLLSATLPAERRQALATAYGCPAGAQLEAVADDYPLITAVAPGTPVLTARPEAASGRSTKVVLERLGDDVALLADRLEAELSQGGCALVVRNTVARVLEAADALRKRFGRDSVTVAHSRFVAADRAAKDADLLARFGPDGDQRPHKHIVVASQVVENSLDVDFDVMVTDLAPVDLVLQRMGRLHRHPRSRPGRLAHARCLVTGVDWQAEPPVPVAGSRAVYPGEFTLLRALGVLDVYLNGRALELPAHISPLVQSAYGPDPVGPDSWAEPLAEAEAAHRTLLARKEEKAEGFLLGPVRRPGRPVYGWLEAHAGDADDSPVGRAQVRDSEETLEVLVIQRRADGTLATLPGLPDGPPDAWGERLQRRGLTLPEDFPPARRAAEAVAASALTLPGLFSKPWTIDRTIADLERFMVPAWQVKECPWLAGELVLVLDEDCQTHLAGFDLYYSNADGLRVAKPGAPTRTGGVPGTGQAGQEGKTHDGEGASGDAVIREPGPGAVTAGRGELARSVRPGSAEEGGTSVVMTSSGDLAEKSLPDRGDDLADREPPSFDLLSMPWIPVQHHDGTVLDVSIKTLFAQAGDFRRIVGDVPTQEVALLRLLLAVLHDAVDGPQELEDWEALWHSSEPFAAVDSYLERHRSSFDLLHRERPFYQVAGLRTAKDEVFPLSRIVADVPTGSAFFTARLGGVTRLSYAEAARWLVHAHAYDTSGIKSAMAGDEDRAKAGKVYPLGVGSLGNLGGIFAEGANLRETLLLNLIAFEEAYADAGRRTDDLPVWRRDPLGPRQREREPLPRGLRDLYTWQSRRIRLHEQNGAITGVVIGYGDPLVMASPWQLEPMSGWRRSPVQEKKQGRTPVYTPTRHDPSRAAWRGLSALVPARQHEGESAKGAEPAKAVRSGVARWFTHVLTFAEIPPSTLVRLRMVGAVYGTQQSVIDELVDDSVVMPVITLHEENQVYGAAAVDAVTEAELSVVALGHLAGNLAKAAGSDPQSLEVEARDLGFGALDGPYRAWLRNLLTYPDLESARQEWRGTVRRIALQLGRQLVVSAGPAAAEGRVVDLPQVGERLMDAGRAELMFRARLDKVLGTEPR
ncbi:type I-E CRISPR-associated protein Cse1/CasA [Streptomyces sp. NPDC002073]